MSHQEKILITGASGFVGSAVARQLAEAGYAVRALVRGASPRGHLAGLNIEFLEGDLRDRTSLERASAGVRYVFHVAADYRLWARDRREIFASNVEGTRNLMEAALGAGVERVIYTSSVATIAVRSDGTAADESIPLREEQGIGAYKRSKIAAERLVEAMVAERGLPAVIVNPSTPIGPCDVKPTPTGRIIVEAARGLHQYRAQPRTRGRCGERSSRGFAAWQDRRTLHPRWSGCLILANVARYRRSGGPASGARATTLACPHSGRNSRRSHCKRHWTRAFRDPGWGPYGQAPHVLRFDQGGTGTGISFKALYRGN
jgi:NAD(P)-dependent dehydrogenase (short-subunit alcohol dehydrogenase family)